MTFEHNENGKPVVIAIEGTGRIDVSYNDDGEISKVESKQGHSMAMKVMSAFQELLRLVEVAKPAAMGRVPDLPHEDLEQIRLRTAFNDAFRGCDRGGYCQTSADQLELISAANAWADHLVEHAADNSEYSEMASQLLAFVHPHTTDSKRGAKLLDERIDAAEISYRRYRKVRPMGLSKGEFESWNEESQLRTLELDGRGLKVWNSLAERLRKAPLTLMQDGRWLPKDDLRIPGYWRMYRSAKVLPKSLSHGRLQSVLVRDNGHVIVGSDVGLLVLRRGFWEWFGFDDRRGKFSRDMSTSRVKSSSNVLSLTEDAAGTLWVGTEIGVL